MGLSEMYTCEYCGKQKDKGGNFCSCGKPKFDKFANTFNCPNCGKRIKDYDSYCENCGASVSKDIYLSYRISNVKKCPSCNNLNDIYDKICSECGRELPIVSESYLIECPGCGSPVLDDINYCRYCGYDFEEYNPKSEEGLGSFAKKIKSSAGKKWSNHRCYNCSVVHLIDSAYCNMCGSAMPTKELYPNVGLTFEEYKLKLVNEFIVPLSNHYQVNFRATTLRNYFDLTIEEEKRIIYVITEVLKENSDIDVLALFETTLEQTKKNFENLDEIIFDTFKKDLTDEFNSGNVSAEGVVIIKDSQYDVVETPVIQDKHSGVTKGFATLGFGLIGLAATSGVKTTMETKKIFIEGEYLHYQINFNKDAVILKTYDDESPDLTFNFDKPNINQTAVIYGNIHSFNPQDFTFILKFGETFKCPNFEFKSLFRSSVLKVVRTYDDAINNYFVNQYSDKLITRSRIILSNLINKEIESALKPKYDIQEHNHLDIGELEKVMEMYEKGLLTDGEFTAMKQNIIKNNTVNENSDGLVEKTEGASKFCSKCGAEIVENSNFCIKCGNRIN